MVMGLQMLLPLLLLLLVLVCLWLWSKLANSGYASRILVTTRR